MNVGSLFAGIGGFDLGFERCGMRTVWQVEQNAYCRAVLAQHFPEAQRFEDVREVGAKQLEPVDLICGGFPCQDISLAGTGGGLDAARSGLWSEYARIVGELEPRWVVVENVPALTSRGLDRVLRDLAALGYDAEWDRLSAAGFGAPHLRRRIWIVAYPGGSGRGLQPIALGGSGGAAQPSVDGPPRPLADADEERRVGRTGQLGSVGRGQPADGGGEADPDPDAQRLQGCQERDGEPQGPGEQAPRGNDADGLRDDAADADFLGREEGLRESSGRDERPRQGDAERSGQLEDADECALQPWRVGGRAAQAGGAEWWAVEPPVGRVAHGIPNRLDRLAALGNALVPQIAEWIGQRILDYEREQMNRHLDLDGAGAV